MSAGPSCSASHIPGYLSSKKLQNAGSVVVVSVNDAFVMKAWAKDLDVDGKSGIRFLADPHAELTNALDLAFDATAIFGQPRSKRYALQIKDGVVTKAFVEPDNTGVNGKCHHSMIVRIIDLAQFQQLKKSWQKTGKAAMCILGRALR